MKTAPAYRARVVAALSAAIVGSASGLADTQSPFDGVWILYRAEAFGKPALTELGGRARDSYDFRTEDPALRCIPASWTRVYSNPNTPLEIDVEADHVLIRYELFDIVRRIPLFASPESLSYSGKSTSYDELGSSAAWFDGDALVIHTRDYGNEARVLSTIRQWAGLPQSPLMTTVERYQRDGDTLRIEITHFDPVMYREPLLVVYTLDLETEFEVELYGCDPDDAAINTLE